MRPYLAVIKDSFREALASRVLWFLLVFITIFHLALAPLGIQEETAAYLQRSDFLNIRGLVSTLVEKGESNEPSVQKEIWEKLSNSLKKQLKEIDDDSATMAYVVVQSRLTKEWNTLLKRDDFYDATSWESIALDVKLRERLEQDSSGFSELQKARQHRQLLDAAFRGSIQPVAPKATLVAYFGNRIGGPLPLTTEQISDSIQLILTQVMIYFAGVFGVLTAILVTSSIIPQTFEAGAIDLLLSKPISRSLLFLTKFFGGCSFILLNVVYFITGLWLYVGFRFEIWDTKLFLCIPVFLFVFTIYYSVSALTGVIWKNAIISVVFTIVFWGLCFSVGLLKNLSETFLNPSRHSVIVAAEETLIATKKSGEAFRWQAESQEWERIFRTTGLSPNQMAFGFFYPLVGPVYDPHNDRLVAISLDSVGFQRIGGTGTLWIGNRKKDWLGEKAIRTPPQADTLLINQKGEILVAGSAGIFRYEPFDPDPAAQSPDEGRFEKVGDAQDDAPWNPPFQATLHPQSGDVLVYHHGNLSLLKEDNAGEYSVESTSKLDIDEPALLAYSGNQMVAAFGNGEIRISDDPLCKTSRSFTPYGINKPRFVSISPNGKLIAVLFHHKKLWLYDIAKQTVVSSEIDGQGDISAVAFSQGNTLLASDRFGRVMEYDIESFEIVNHAEATAGTWEQAYLYGINPLYTIFPKPGELDLVVSYLLTDQESQAIGGQENDLQAERAVLDIWTPIWSNLAFLAVILSFTCFYISRRDF